MATIELNAACPTCLQSGVENGLMSTPGRYGYFCKENHQFNDTESLRMGKLQKLSTPPPEKLRPPAPGSVEMRFMVPGELNARLMARFGNKLQASISGILQALLDDGSFIVSGMDAARLSEHLGGEIIHTQALVGRVFSMRKERDQFKDGVERASQPVATMVPSKDGKMPIVVPLDQDSISALQEKAKFQGKPVPELLSETIKFALDNNWM